MSDNVKFIFKTLLKVPIIILVSYLIFNLFAFVFSYFRLVGLSYVTMQTAVENNFLPNTELRTLQNYADSLVVPGIFDNIQVCCDTSVEAGADGMDYSLDVSNNSKVQYGTPIAVSITAKYTWVFPLVNTFGAGKDERYAAESAAAAGNGGNGVIYNDINNANSEHNIVITYVVPGLKYYPDLS